MKKLIIAVLVATVALTGCAQRNPDGSHILDSNGKEKISWPRTIAVVVGAPLLILGVAAMAKNSDKWGGGSNAFASGVASGMGGYGGSYYGSRQTVGSQYACQHADDTDSLGRLCGGRAAAIKTGGREPGLNYADRQWISEHE